MMRAEYDFTRAGGSPHATPSSEIDLAGVWELDCGRADFKSVPARLPVAELTPTPAAMTQGENRLRRFMNYRRYVALFPEWEKKCRFVSVPGAGHQWSLVCRAPEFVRLVFGVRE